MSLLHFGKGRGSCLKRGLGLADCLALCLDGMLNSTTWLYGAEVLPIALRSKVMGLAAASHFIVNVASEF